LVADALVNVVWIEAAISSDLYFLTDRRATTAGLVPRRVAGGNVADLVGHDPC